MMDFREREIRWEALEVDMDAIQEKIKTISSSIDRLEPSAQKVAYALMDICSAELKRLLSAQQEIEMFLVENEAPGWTST